MPSNLENLTIARFAEACGVHVETVRYYQRRGLLKAPARPSGGIRRYGPADVARLLFVKSAQRLGFSLDEVAQLLRLDDGAHCNEISEIAARRLEDVRARLSDLERLEAVLSKLVRRCRTEKGQMRCPLIASLDAAPLMPIPSSTREELSRQRAGARAK